MIFVNTTYLCESEFLEIPRAMHHTIHYEHSGTSPHIRSQNRVTACSPKCKTLPSQGPTQSGCNILFAKRENKREKERHRETLVLILGFFPSLWKQPWQHRLSCASVKSRWHLRTNSDPTELETERNGDFVADVNSCSFCLIISPVGWSVYVSFTGVTFLLLLPLPL